MNNSAKTAEQLPSSQHHRAIHPTSVGLIGILLFALASLTAVAQVKEWDPGLPKDLFKDGPPGRLREAKCKDCKDDMAKLQAALDDWYAMELSEGQQDRKDAVSIQDNDANKAKNAEAKSKIDEAMAGLGQPKDKGKAAQKKQEQNSANDAKEKDNKGKRAKDILKSKIQKLLKDLQDCEKNKCPKTEEVPTPTPTPVPGGGGTTGGGGTAGGGGTTGGGGGQTVPPPPNITIPPPPPGGCFKDQAEKDAYLDKLDKQRKPIFDQWYIDRKEANEDNANQAAKNKFAQSDANLRAIDAAIAAANAMGFCPTPTPKPAGGGGKSTGPGKGKPKAPPKVRTGGNVSLPEDNFCALISESKIKIDTSGTGETIGHVCDLTVANQTDEPVTVAVPPLILESRSGKNQHYACPKGQTVEVPPHEKKTVPVDGVCLVRNKPPVGKGQTGDLLISQCDGDSKISRDKAHDLLRIAKSKYDAADKLEDDGLLKEIPYKDKKKRKEIVEQWSTWMDPRISEVTGAPPATKDDLKKVVYKQVEEKGPMTPETKKKVDQGIDTIFEKVELTTEKAKDLEEPAETETTGAPESGNTFEISDNQGQSTETPAPQTKEKPKKEKKKKKYPKPIQDWVDKYNAASDADKKKKAAQDDYTYALHKYCYKNQHYNEVMGKKNAAKQKADAQNATQADQDNYDNAKKEAERLEAELDKEFKQTDDGKKEFQKVADAEKEATQAHDAEKAAEKNVPPGIDKDEIKKAEDAAKAVPAKW